MKVPYYSDEQLWQRASIERERTWDETLPVDIELIVEEQGIEVIPLPGLRKNASIDACMSRDTNTIYIDHEYVEDPRMLFRVRFSVAHEYAHRILHKEVFEQFLDDALTDSDGGVLAWARKVREFQGGDLLERQADEFAGSFLVPKDPIRALVDQHLPAVRELFEQDDMSLDRVSDDAVRKYLANPIHRAFEVSTKVVEIRLRKYGLYPLH